MTLLRPLLFFSALYVLLFCAGLGAEEGGGSANLFIKTVPMSAGVEINGRQEPGTSPRFLKKIPAGSYSVTVYKEGFLPSTRTVDLADGKTGTLEFILEKTTITPVFPEGRRIIFNGRNIFSGDELLSLPPGAYTMDKNQGLLKLTAQYPGQVYITALNFSLPLVALLTGVSAANDFLGPVNRTASGPASLSPATITGLTVAGILGIADILLNLKKKQFYDSFPVETVKPGDLTVNASAAYGRAERMLEQNQLQDAMGLYSEVCRDYPDSVYYPMSLYKTARIQFILGELSMVGAELLLIKNRYPLPELYDKTCKTLADLYYRLGRYESGLKELDDMVFLDPLYSREAVDLYRGEILEAWYAEDPAVLEKTAAMFSFMVNTYRDSQNISTYLFKAAYYAYRLGAAAEALKFLDAVEQVPEELAPSIDSLRELLSPSVPEPAEPGAGND